MKGFIIRHIEKEVDKDKLVAIMQILGIRDVYFKRKKCVHKWKYLSGSPMNELHECAKCGVVG